jgi:hypothetical protein
VYLLSPVRNFSLAIAVLGAVTPMISGAQESSGGHKSAWLIPVVGITAAVIGDGEVREWAFRQHSSRLDHLAKVVNPLGTGSHLMPAMAITWAGGMLAHDRSLANGTLETAAAYAVNNVAESLLKPMIGRQRPHVSGNPRRFRPFTSDGDWHSFPSAHIAHITSIAAAVAAQTRSRPVNIVGDVLVTLVSWDRVYEDQHWTSDAAATIALSSFISRRTVRWIDSHVRGKQAPTLH